MFIPSLTLNPWKEELNVSPNHPAGKPQLLELRKIGIPHFDILNLYRYLISTLS